MNPTHRRQSQKHINVTSNRTHLVGIPKAHLFIAQLVLLRHEPQRVPLFHAGHMIRHLCNGDGMLSVSLLLRFVFGRKPILGKQLSVETFPNGRKFPRVYVK